MTTKTTTANSTFAIGGVSCSADTFVVNQAFIISKYFLQIIMTTPDVQ
jgi:hypothetical protein